MFYTTGQLRDSVGISKEAFRHWKRFVPAFANGRGRVPSFSSGDVLASAVLRQLTDAAGVRIGHLSSIASAIFEVCNASSWDDLQHQSLIIDLQAGSCVARHFLEPPVGNLVLVCALSPLINALRFELLNDRASFAQSSLEQYSNDERNQTIRGQR